jgi:hypothetical protein
MDEFKLSFNKQLKIYYNPSGGPTTVYNSWWVSGHFVALYDSCWHFGGQQYNVESGFFY